MCTSELSMSCGDCNGEMRVNETAASEGGEQLRKEQQAKT